MGTDDKLVHSISVIAKSIAFLCLHQSKAGQGNLGEQALFLEALGFSEGEQTTLLNSTRETLSAMKSRARKGKGGKRGVKKEGTKARKR